MNGTSYPDGFTIVDNRIINSELSPDEKNLYIFISSKPESWNFSGHRIAKQIGISYPRVVRTLQKLEARNLLFRERTETRRVKYSLPPIEDSNLLSCEKLSSFEVENKRVKEL